MVHIRYRSKKSPQNCKPSFVDCSSGIDSSMERGIELRKYNLAWLIVSGLAAASKSTPLIANGGGYYYWMRMCVTFGIE